MHPLRKIRHTWDLIGKSAVSSIISGLIGLLAASTFKVEVLFSAGIILLIVGILAGIIFIIWLYRNIRPFVGNREDDPPDPTAFDYIEFSSVLQKPDKLIIVVGSKKQTTSNRLNDQWRVADADLRVAERLQSYL